MRVDVIARIDKQKFVSIVTDGWTDPNGEKIVNFMVVAPEMPSLFWSSWASGTEAHTADNLTKKTKEVVMQIEELTKARVVGIVTDNAKNMHGVWSRLKSLAIVAGGCAAHVLNLLMKDLFADAILKKVYSNCVQLSRFVRDHNGLLETFRDQLSGVRARGQKRSGLTLPVPTRWYSVFNCLENVFANRDELYELFTSPEHATLRRRYAQKEASRAKLKYVAAIVEDLVFWENLRVVIRLIKPIRTALGKIESDNHFASSVYSCFKSLLQHDAYRERVGVTTGSSGQSARAAGDGESALAAGDGEPAPAAGVADDSYDELPDPAYSTGYAQSEPIVSGVLESLFRKKIQQRWSYVHTNAMGIAFFLDPRCKFTDFVDDDEVKTHQAITKFALDKGIIELTETSELTRQVFAFADVKADEEAMEKTSPRLYWKSMERSFPLLGKIANIVFALPTSSAASERAWSIFNHIHTKKRNRLSVAKVELLVYIYINYPAIKNEKVDIAWYVSQPESFDNTEDH